MLGRFHSDNYHAGKIMLKKKLYMALALSMLWGIVSCSSSQIPSATPTPIGSGSGKIAFIALPETTERSEIYVVSSNGTGYEQFETLPIQVDSFSWSPDGTKIAFEYDSNIYTIGTDGSKLTKLTHGTQTETLYENNSGPAWSPDSSQIAFSSYDGEKDSIYKINADGSNLVRLTSSSGFDSAPTWSPNGKQIAFQGSRWIDQDWNTEIYLINTDGSEQAQLTTQGHNVFPRFSPDGKHLVFLSDRDNQQEGRIQNEIYIMNADGSGQRRITFNEGIESYPAWSPDGSLILFIDSTLAKSSSIYFIRLDGSQQTKLISVGAWSAYPQWLP